MAAYGSFPCGIKKWYQIINIFQGIIEVRNSSIVTKLLLISMKSTTGELFCN